MQNENKNLTVLAVDDDPANLHIIVNTLNKYADVMTALNGKTALMTLEKHVPDLIILDLRMPIISGLKLCEVIKANERLNEVPIIFLTSSDEIEDIKAGVELGVSDYLIKPLRPDSFQYRIFYHLAKKNIDVLHKELSKDKKLKITKPNAVEALFSLNTLANKYCYDLPLEGEDSGEILIKSTDESDNNDNNDNNDNTDNKEP